MGTLGTIIVVLIGGTVIGLLGKTSYVSMLRYG